jgi:hypothetical protein
MGISTKWCFHYDIGYNNGSLTILCHVVYATLGFPIGGEAFGENQNITITCTRTAKNAARFSLCSLLPVV